MVDTNLENKADLESSWRGHLRVLMGAARHYISRMLMGLGAGAALWIVGAIVGIWCAVTATTAPPVNVAGQWRVILAILLLGVLTPVGYFFTTQGAAIKGSVSFILRARPEILHWAIHKVVSQIERVVPNLWTRTVNLDHRLVRQAYSALDADGMPRVGAFILRRVLRKVDFPALLELELRTHDERYTGDEVKAALQQRVFAAVVEMFQPSWMPWFLVFALQFSVQLWLGISAYLRS